MLACVVGRGYGYRTRGYFVSPVLGTGLGAPCFMTAQQLKYQIWSGAMSCTNAYINYRGTLIVNAPTRRRRSSRW